MSNSRPLIGVIENIELPILNLGKIVTRIDTGAKTSALHVDHLKVEESNKKVNFWFHPDFHDIEKIVKCSARIHDVRWVKSSNGNKEKRIVIQTPARLNDQEWLIELTLTDRSVMKHLMLFGREAMSHRFLIDPAEKYLLS